MKKYRCVLSKVLNMSEFKILGKIDNDFETLDEIHADFKFCPDSNSVRPTEEMKEFKIGKIIEIKNDWYEFRDYILHSIFGLDYKEYKDGSKKVKYVENNKIINKEYVFVKQMFPYQVEGNHWVMWYPTEFQIKSDDEISKDIYYEVKNLVGSENFDFCWYINPTMTVKDFFHVQVFWDEL